MKYQEHKREYSDELTDLELSYILQGSPSFIDNIPAERMTAQLVDMIIGINPRYLMDIPKEKWTEDAIVLTVVSKDINHLIDPSLITEKIIDKMFNYSSDILSLLPFDLHTQRHCEKSVLLNFSNILIINPIYIEAVISKALDENTSYWGGFADIKDAYKADLSELISSLNNDIPNIKRLNGKAKRTETLLLVYKHRLSAVDEKEFISLCKKLNAPETLKFVHGSHQAARNFPGLNKRQWLQDDLQL